MNSKNISESYKTVCRNEHEDVQKLVHRRLREYLDSWTNDVDEVRTAILTKKYFTGKKITTLEDRVEYLVASIIIDASESEVYESAAF